MYYVIDFSDTNGSSQQTDFVLCAERNQITQAFPVYWAVLVFLAFLLGLAMILILYYQLKTNASTIRTTKKLQLMLFKVGWTKFLFKN